MKLAMLTDARFHAALAKLTAQPVPLRVAFKLKGVLAKVNEELRKYEECRQDALERLGKKGEDGKLVLSADNSVQFEKGGLERFSKELTDLGNMEVELPTVKLEEVGDIQLTAEEVYLLDGVLVE